MAEEFATLLEECLADPDAADFEALRAAYAASPLYLPFGRDPEDMEELNMRIATKRWEEARELVEELLDFDPLHIALRFSYALVLERLDDEYEASTQRRFANGLLRTILRTGDGRTPAGAIRVLDMRELSLVLEVMGCRALRSQLSQIAGRWIDAVEVSDRSGEGRVVHFDVDVPQNKLAKLSREP